MKKTYTNTKIFMGGRNTMNFNPKAKMTQAEEKELYEVLMSNKDAFNEELKDFLIGTFEQFGYDTSFIHSNEFKKMYVDLIGNNNSIIQDAAYAFMVNDKYEDYFKNCQKEFMTLLCGEKQDISKIEKLPNDHKSMYFIQCMSFLYIQNTYRRIDFMNSMFELVAEADEKYIKKRAFIIGLGFAAVGMNMNYLKNYVAKMGF